MWFFRFERSLASWRYSKGCDRGREFQKQSDSSAEESTRVLTDESIGHSSDGANDRTKGMIDTWL